MSRDKYTLNEIIIHEYKLKDGDTEIETDYNVIDQKSYNYKNELDGIMKIIKVNNINKNNQELSIEAIHETDFYINAYFDIGKKSYNVEINFGEG